jgi:hypothetical protein
VAIGARYYLSQLPRFFSDMATLREEVLKQRAARRMHELVENSIAFIADRLSLSTVPEIYAVSGVRNDALSTHPGKEILWEVFGTLGRVDEDLRKLEGDHEPKRLKVAVVLDQEIDESLFKKFTRKRQTSGDRIKWLRVGDLMLTERVPQTMRLVQGWLDELRPRWDDELELVDFGLYGEHQHWYRVDWLPLAFAGLRGWQPTQPLEEPTFYVDVQNIGTREARISIAYVNLRFRQEDLHGPPGEQVLRAAAQVRVPLEGGQEGYREAELPDPVLVKPGEHARILIGLNDPGFAWCGELEIGLRYGPERRVVTPAVSIFL